MGATSNTASNLHEGEGLEAAPPAPADLVQLQEDAFLEGKSEPGDGPGQCASIGISQLLQHLPILARSLWIFPIARRCNNDRVSGALVPGNKRPPSREASYERIVKEAQCPAVGDRVQCHLSP